MAENSCYKGSRTLADNPARLKMAAVNVDQDTERFPWLQSKSTKLQSNGSHFTTALKVGDQDEVKAA